MDKSFETVLNKSQSRRSNGMKLTVQMKKSSILMIVFNQTLCRALILLRNKSLVSAIDLLTLFFELLKCNDKSLRQFLKTHIINDIKNVNSKHKNAKLNTVSDWIRRRQYFAGSVEHTFASTQPMVPMLSFISFIFQTGFTKFHVLCAKGQ